MDIITEDENFVAEEVAENVEQTTEETVVEQPKMFTQEQVNEMIGKAKARTRAKVEKDFNRQYGDLTAVLRAGMGKEDVGEITQDLRDFYGKRKGIEIPEQPSYTEQDVAVLAQADADEIINAGDDEVVEEVERLTNVGFENMTPREKALFKTLAEHRQNAERSKALAEIGVPESVYNSQEFKDFAGQFVAAVPITQVYKMFEKTHKTSSVEPIGSMKNGNHGEEKTYYSPEDVDKLTPEDYDNPVVFQRVRESMKRWYKS